MVDNQKNIIFFFSVSDPDPDPLHFSGSGSGSTSIPAPDPYPDPDPLRFLSSDPDPDPLKKALIWIRVTPKLFRVKSKTKCFCYLRNAFLNFGGNKISIVICPT